MITIFIHIHKTFSDTLYSSTIISPKVARMSTVGGSGIDSTTRRILKTLMSDHVAKMYNWKGRDKLSFEKTNIMPLIYGNESVVYMPNVVRQNIFVAEALKRSYPIVLEHNVDSTVKSWLKMASARLQTSKKPFELPNPLL